MMSKEILSAFSHLKVHYSIDGSEMRFFWSFIFESKSTIAAPCIIFWFREEDSFGLILLDCSFKYSKTTFQCHNDNVCKTSFKYSKTTFKYFKTTFSKIWTRYGQASCYVCFEDKSGNFTIHCTIHRLLFTNYYLQSLFTFTVHGAVHSEFLPKGGCPLSLGEN